MKRTYPLYIILTLGLLVAAILKAEGSLLLFWDVPSVLILYGPLLFMLLTSYTPVEIIKSFKVAMKNSQSSILELKNAYLMFETAQFLTYKISILGFLLGIVMLLGTDVQTSQMGKLGLYVAVAILCIVYAMITIIVITAPFKLALKKKILALEAEIIAK